MPRAQLNNGDVFFRKHHLMRVFGWLFRCLAEPIDLLGKLAKCCGCQWQVCLQSRIHRLAGNRWSFVSLNLQRMRLQAFFYQCWVFNRCKVRMRLKLTSIRLKQLVRLRIRVFPHYPGQQTELLCLPQLESTFGSEWVRILRVQPGSTSNHQH